MRKSILIAIIFSLIGWFANTAYHNPTSRVDLAGRSFPLEKYTIENLANTQFKPSEIKIEDEHLFSFIAEGKKLTGCINIPEGDGPFPVIVLLRGYVDQSIYTTGTGTKRVGEYFSKNGYITLAPDFLGYGSSDIESSNIFEARFQTYITALTLLKSINKEVFVIKDNGETDFWVDSKRFEVKWAEKTSSRKNTTILSKKDYNPNTSVFQLPIFILNYLKKNVYNTKD